MISRLLIFGGGDSTSKLDTVQSAFLADPTNWADTGATLPGLVETGHLAGINGFYFLYGGFDGVNTLDTIYRAPIKDAVSWEDTGESMVSPLRQGHIAIIGDYVYLFGGQDGSTTVDTIYRAPVSDPTNWVDTEATLPTALRFGHLGIIGDYVYIFGGLNASSTILNTIHRAPLVAPTSWADTGSTLQSELRQGHIATIGDYVYLFGGVRNTGTSDKIYRAPVSNPTNWSDTGSTLPSALRLGQLAVIDAYVYLFGGDNGSSVLDKIYSAPVSNPTNWSDTGSTLSAPVRSSHSGSGAIGYQEQAYPFSVSPFVESFYGFQVDPSTFTEAEFQYLVSQAVKFESEHPFNVSPTLKAEDQYKFDLIAYKAYEDMYRFAIKAGHLTFEAEFPFNLPSRENELYEQMYRYYTNGAVVESSIQAGLSVIIDNAPLKVISVSGGRNGYYNLFEVVVPDDRVFQSLPIGAEALLSWHSARLSGDISTPVVDKQFPLIFKQASFSEAVTDQGDQKRVSIRLVSPTAQLDRLPDPIGGLPVTAIWQAGTLATAVLDDLCLPHIPYTLEYADYPLLQDLDGGNRYPIEIINELFPLAWIGPNTDGNLLIRRKLLHSPGEMLAEGFQYDLDIPRSEYAIDIQTDHPSVPLYNSVTVATVSESDSVIFPAPEIVQEDNDPTRAKVYGYRYPWVPFELVTCNTECNNVQIPAGKEEIVEITRSLDFEDGKASFPHPIHEFVSVDWGCNTSLGTITASGDGSLQAAASGWSFGEVTCKVLRRVFKVTSYNGRPDDLKFRLRDEE